MPLRPQRNQLFAVGAALIFLLSGDYVSGQEAAQDSQPPQQVDVEALIRDLNAEDYQTREDATQKLIELGDEQQVEFQSLAADPPRPELKVGAQKIFCGTELADIRRDAVRLDVLFELVRRANAEDFDQDALTLSLTQLAKVVNTSKADGEDEWTLPVQFDDVHRQEPGTSVQDGLVIARRGRITSLRNSIVLADVAMDVTSAQDSIIIAPAQRPSKLPARGRSCSIWKTASPRLKSRSTCSV